jgi:hypothetical protein
MDFNIPAFRYCLPSRCLAMVFHKPLSSDGRVIRHIATFLRLFIPNSLMVHYPFGRVFWIPVYFFLRHYHSLLRFARPEELLDRLRGDPGTSLCCSYGAKYPSGRWPLLTLWRGSAPPHCPLLCGCDGTGDLVICFSPVLFL